MADFHSYPERKNPLGAVQAFKMAFGDRREVGLVVKTVNSHSDPAAFGALEEAARGSNVIIRDGYIDRAALHGLFRCCDCFVGLHRSEGFGLPLAEMMYLGKPVIATAYSGNLEFMNPGNAYLVNYRLVELEQDYGPYKRGNVWAEADLEHAAALMRAAAEDEATTRAIAARGAEDVRRELSPARVGERMRQRLLVLCE